jgi:spore coat polysaccharide biosynthesis protein SpsF
VKFYNLVYGTNGYAMTMSNHTKLRTIIIVQARLGSTRLPGKIFKKVLEKPLLTYEIERLQRVTLADEVIIATTTNPLDQGVVDFCHHLQIPVFRGSEEDVLDRYYQAAKNFGAEVVVRVSGDCPLIDPQIIDEVLAFFLNNFPTYQYVSNTLERTYPRGMDVEVFSFNVLEKAAKAATRPEEREHVTPYIYRHPEWFALANIRCESNESHFRLTVDTIEDFQLVSAILEALYPTNPNFTMHDVLDLLKKHPEWININAHIQQKPLT